MLYTGRILARKIKNQASSNFRTRQRSPFDTIDASSLEMNITEFGQSYKDSLTLSGLPSFHCGLADSESPWRARISAALH